MLAKRTYKNQITLPKAIAEQFPKTEYFDVVCKGEVIVLRPVDVTPRRATLEMIRRKVKALGLTESDVEEAVAWARRRRP